MRNIRFLIIMACFLSGLFYISCERIGYVNDKEIRDDQRIQSRTVEECEDCPGDDDCCCAIELRILSDNINLQFCGTSDGASACLGDDDCGSTFSGGGQIISLDPLNPRKLFCMGPGNSFWIKNLSMNLYASFYLTCQYDLTSPQILTISIPPNETWYYEANNSCELSDCQ